MRVCRAAEAESRAQALGSIPSLVETDTQERPTPREFGDEAWAGVTSWEWEAFFSVEAVRGRTVHQIPQRARSGVLDALCCVLKRLKSRPGDEAATLLLLAFPRLILAMPPKPGIGQKALITERLGAFWEGRWRELFDSAMVAARPAVRSLAYTCSDQDPDAIRLSRCRSRCKVGKWSRGMACLTGGELARPSEAMVQSLREKHPASTGKSLESARGSRQGDPLGPFLFAFTQQLVMESVTREFRDLLFLSYADDSYILGPAARILEAFGVLRERLEWVGLEVQAHKCRFWEREGGDVERALPLGMQRVEEGLTVVGVPIGEEDWDVVRLRERLRQLQAPLPWIPLLDHPHMASHLLAIAVSAWPMYLARTMLPRPEVVEAVSDWDRRLEDYFEQLFPPGTWEQEPDRSRRARMQLLLPVRLGGFGIRAAASLSPLSYVCGWAQAARDIAQLGVAGKEAMFAEYLTTSAGAEFLDPWFAKAIEQLPAIIRQEMPGLPLSRDDATLARFTSLQGSGAGAWVSAVPALSDLTFTAAEWGIAVAIRLGLPIRQLQVAGRCVCGTAYVDPADPHHALRCNNQHGPSRVHDEREAHALEISVANPLSLSPSLLGQCGRSIGVAAKEWERRKMSDYAPLLARNRGVQFTPLIVETWGCLGSRFRRWLRQQRDAHAELAVSQGACREDDTSFSAYLLGSLKPLIGVALQQAQARVILLRAGSSMGGMNVDLVDRERDDVEVEGGALWVEAPYMVDVQINVPCIEKKLTRLESSLAFFTIIMPSSFHSPNLPPTPSYPRLSQPSRIAALFALVALASLLTCIFLSLPPAAPPPLPLVPLTAIAAAAHPHAAVTAAGGRGGTSRRLQGLRAPRDTKRKWNGGSFLEFSADESARINGLGGSGSARDARAQRESGEKGAEKTRNSGWPGVNRRGGGMVWRVGWWGGGGGSDGSKSDAVGASDERAHGGVAESARALAVTARGGRGGLHSEGGKSRGAREAKGEAQDAVAPVVEAQQVEGRGEGGEGVATGMRAVGRLADMEVLSLGQGMGGRRQAVAGGDEGGSACERMAGRAVQRVGRRGALVPEEGRAPANATSPARRGGESRARAAAKGRGQWRVRRVALHPAVRRSTGLPLRCHQWRSDAVFLLSAALPGHGLSPLLLVRPRLPTCPLPTIFPSKLSHILPLLLRSPPFPTYSPLVSLFIPSAFPLSPPLCFHTCFPPCFFPSSCFLASSPRCPPMCTPLCGAMPCRGQELDARLQAVGLQYTLALVPRNVSHAHALRYAPLYRAAPQGGGRAGAGRQDVRYSAAHAEVWARVVAARMPFALVLEEDALNRSEGVAAWQARFEMLLWELNLLMLQRADRFFFDVLLLARHGLAPYAEQQLAPGIVSAQPSEAMHAYLLSYAGAKRLLALSRFHSPVAESTGGIPGMTILAAEPPLFATTIFACSPKPCRTPPPALSLPASTRLTPACRSTILLTLPAHPSMPGAALHAPWRMHDPVPAGPRPSIPSSSPAFCPHLSPAQCLLANHLPRLLPHVRAPPLLLLPPTLPPSLPLWPAYVLSLRRSPQRLQRVLPLLQQQGFGDVVVAHGVDGGRGQRGGEGAQGRGEEAEAEAERNLDVFGGLVGAGAVSVTRRSIKWHKLAERRRERLTRGEVACALSHYLVWLEVLRRKLPYTIILEDDVTFTTSTFRADFERNIAEANELLTRQHSPESPPDIMFVGHMGVLAGHFMPLLSPHIAWDPLSWCSFAYIISHRGAAHLVAGFKVDDPLDSLWWRRPNLAFWAFQPPLAFHLSSPRLNSSVPLSPPSPPAPPPPSHPPHPSSTHRTAHSSSSSSIKDKASSSGAEVAGSSRAGKDIPLPVPLYPSEVQQGGGQWM
ncbi:unnamed protein product [Closterium sp. NIES-54]